MHSTSISEPPRCRTLSYCMGFAVRIFKYMTRVRLLSICFLCSMLCNIKPISKANHEYLTIYFLARVLWLFEPSECDGVFRQYSSILSQRGRNYWTHVRQNRRATYTTYSYDAHEWWRPKAYYINNVDTLLTFERKPYGQCGCATCVRFKVFYSYICNRCEQVQ